ncbi:MAG: YgiQ family radical SAM protein [Candidatus Omnitrophota bacterium]|jgi:uncharacterized radical SAM protein YgiQ
MSNGRFLPTTKKEMAQRGWHACDVILVTGDAYVDHPSYGTAVIGRVLEDAGYKVGIIAQPDWRRSDDFMKFGKPRLFFGVSAGNLDSILSNYSVNRKLRRTDAYSPGGRTGLRPNRASIVYANKIKELFPGVPVVLGGIEASMRRLAHYDYWDDAVRRSVLVDAKADILIYGMGEKPVLEVAERIRKGEDFRGPNGIRQTAVICPDISAFKDAVVVPGYEEIREDKDAFSRAFQMAYPECDPVRGKTVIQKHGERYLVQFPPAYPLSTPEMDHIYGLPYLRDPHPGYARLGGVPGFEVVKFSIISHRGCSAECNFCSLYAHQGRIIQSRSKESILGEVMQIADRKDFRGTLTDIGGPTANLYDAFCETWGSCGACRDKHCMVPKKCPSLKLGYEKTIELWAEVMKIPKVKHLFISSGLRYDLLVEKEAEAYLRALCKDHISGQLKVAPEHNSDSVLKLMNKTSFKDYEVFAEKFRQMNYEVGKKQFLVNYFISAHPGSGLKEALHLALYLVKNRIQPEQVQDFIPLPMTVSGCMYYTGNNPLTGDSVYSAKDPVDRHMQRALLQYKQPQNRKYVAEALHRAGRSDLVKIFCEWGGSDFRGRPGKARRGPKGKAGHSGRDQEKANDYEDSWEL